MYSKRRKKKCSKGDRLFTNVKEGHWQKMVYLHLLGH